jgi:hypothetical protein
LNLTIKHNYVSALQSPEWVVAGSTSRYAVPDSLTIAPSILTWTCSHHEWQIMPSNDGYHCDLGATTFGQGILTARTGVECDSLFSITVNASGFDVEENKTTEIQLFPNPAYSQVSIVGTQINQIRVINSLGQVALERVCESESLVVLEIGSLPKGVYSVEIATARGRVVKRLLLLQ